MAKYLPKKSKVLLITLFAFFTGAFIIPYHYTATSLNSDIKKNELNHQQDIARLFILLDLAKIVEYEYLILEKKVNTFALEKERSELIKKVSLYFEKENQELFKRFENIFQHFDLYHENIKKIGHKDYGLVGKMRRIVHKIEDDLSDKPKELMTLLQMRRDEKDYLLRHEVMYSKSLFLKSVTLMNSSRITSEQKQQIATYVDYFSRIRDLTEENKLTLQIYNTESEQLKNLLKQYLNNIAQAKEGISLKQTFFLKNFIILGVVSGTLLIIIILYTFTILKKESTQKEELLTDLQKQIDEKNRLQDELVSREKLAGLGGLAAGIAHEIKNPLNLITNSSKIINELLFEINEEQDELKKLKMLDQNGPLLIKTCKIITNNISRANEIIRNILDLARGAKDTDFRPCNLRDLILENYSLSFHAMKATTPLNIEFLNELDDVGDYECLRTDLSRALINIFDNSFYSLNQKFKKTNFSPAIHIKLYRKDFKRILIIRDNAEGINSENLKKVQNPFFTTKPPGEGTGLGLSFVSDVVKAHSAILSIKSVENEYTEIRIEF